MTVNSDSIPPKTRFQGIKRRIHEFGLIAQDPILMIALIFSIIILTIFIFFPIFRTIIRGFVSDTGEADFTHFARYLDGTFLQGINTFFKNAGLILQETATYGRTYRLVLSNTIKMGIFSATFGTFLGFIFAYATVRCNIPGKKFVHLLALVPTVSPPFAVAIAMIQMFGRNGLITKTLLGIKFTPGMNDIYGMDGLVIVQTLTFFPIAYLMLESMMERLDASMEEAAETLGASRFYLFRTITLPLLIPGIASSFLLLFVESLADLGNPQFISGNVTVLSSQIYMSVIGEFNYQKASALSFVLLLPTLIVYIVQRYYITRRSYVSVTGKPTVGRVYEKNKTIRIIFATMVYLVCILILLVYITVIASSFVKGWGIDFTPTLSNWTKMFGRGLEAIFDTTFLSLYATPFAALLGMIIAFLIVRKKFAGKEILDFGSNLGGAVPGTIVGMGFILAFNFNNPGLAVFLIIVCSWFYITCVSKANFQRVKILIPGIILGLIMSCLDDGGFLWGKNGWLTGPVSAESQAPAAFGIGLNGIYYLIGAIFILIGFYFLLQKNYRKLGKYSFFIGVYIILNKVILIISKPIRIYGKTQSVRWWKAVCTQFADYIEVPFSLPTFFLGVCLFFITAIMIYEYHGKFETFFKTLFMILSIAILFTGDQMKMNGTAYIILFAFLIRSLPASVRSGVAALQQIDGSIEEASNILGGDSQYTFRKVTLPLILPAFMTGLIFSFTRHMTSLSAIIFLVSAKWQIVTASIMSGWEQDGISYAATYSSVIIFIVLIFIGLMGVVTRKVLKIDTNIDLNAGF